MLDDSGRDITYRGGPSRAVAAAIKFRCHTDSEGRRYFQDRSGTFKKLRTLKDFAELNALIDEVRKGDLCH